jgi:methyl halide transferase
MSPADLVTRLDPFSTGPDGIKRMDPEAWEQRYRTGDTPWDIGRTPPPLERLLKSLPPGSRRVLVPGAGLANDALAWAEAGHDVWAVDIAPTAVAAARRRAQGRGLPLKALQADLFALPRALDGAFQLIWEQTCFCAIPPARRSEYVHVMARCLAPGGVFYGLFWNHGMPGGPPFDVQPALVHSTFSPLFEILAVDRVPNSVPQRRDQEFLATLRLLP